MNGVVLGARLVSSADHGQGHILGGRQVEVEPSRFPDLPGEEVR